MFATAMSRIASLFTVAVVLLAAAPAGSNIPNFIRTATIHGIRGPVYYSTMDRRFHPIVPAGSIASPERVAINLDRPS